MSYNLFLEHVLKNSNVVRKARRKQDMAVMLKPKTSESKDHHGEKTKSMVDWSTKQQNPSIIEFLASHFSTNGETKEIPVLVLFKFYQLFKHYKGETLEQFTDEMGENYKMVQVNDNGVITGVRVSQRRQVSC